MVKNYKGFNSVLITIIILSALIYLATGETAFTANLIDADNQIISSQSITIPRGIFVSQSIFGSDFDTSELLLHSAIPIDDLKRYANFDVMLQNPFQTTATLDLLEIYKNGELIDEIEFNEVAYQPEEKRAYSTKQILVEATQNRVNLIQLEFTFKNDLGTKLIQTYKFQYLYLNRCHTDKDCSGFTKVCDLDNRARLSTVVGELYCAQPCASNGQCAEGQLCLQGLCGY